MQVGRLVCASQRFAVTALPPPSHFSGGARRASTNRRNESLTHPGIPPCDHPGVIGSVNTRVLSRAITKDNHQRQHLLGDFDCQSERASMAKFAPTIAIEL